MSKKSWSHRVTDAHYQMPLSGRVIMVGMGAIGGFLLGKSDIIAVLFDVGELMQFVIIGLLVAGLLWLDQLIFNSYKEYFQKSGEKKNEK